MELSLKSFLPSRWCWLFLYFPLLGHAFALDPRLEQDTYGLGMGSAVVAVVGGTHAIEWNPAGIARASVPMAQIGLGYDPSSTDLSFNLSALYPLPDGTVFALSQFSEFPSSPGSTTTYVGTVAMPLNASHDLFLGINLKYLALSIVDGGVLQNGRGLGMDLGLAYDLRNAQGTMASFGLAVKDVATDVRFDNNAEQPVVRTFVIGAAYQNIKDTRIEADYDIIDQTTQASSLHNRLRVGAERFFSDRFYSVRAGYDDVLGDDGYFSLGAGYHANQPFELAYAFRMSTTRSDSVHSLSFTYHFDDWRKAESGAAKPPEISSSAEITLNPAETLTEAPPTTGRPVSEVPLRKMAITVDPPAFSPSGRQKTTTIAFPGDQSSDIARWLVEIQGPQQKIVRRIGGTGSLFPMLGWDGTDDQGRAVANGTYRITLRTYGHKNEPLSDDFQTVEVVTARSHFGLQTASPYFSPRAGKGGKKEVGFNIQSGGSSDVQSWELEISEASSNKVVYTTQGQNQLPKTLRWNGRNGQNQVVADRTYLCLLTAQDRAGNPLKSDAIEIFVISSAPILSLKGDDHWADFSTPKDFRFQLEAADRMGFQSWKVSLLDENGMTLKSFEGNGQPPKEVVWDGKTSQGKEVEGGALVSGSFQATDKAGNNATSEAFPVQIEVKAGAKGEQMTLNLTTVYFPMMGTTLSEAAKKDLDKAATTIKPYLNKSTLVVKGYAAPNETGDLIALSHNRASEVKMYLMKILNVSDNGIFAVGYATRVTEKDASPATADNQRRALVVLSTQP